jgi:hypothetical protein
MGLTKDLGSIPRAITVSGSNNNVGISKETPNAKLDVNGNTIITGSLNVTQGITGSLFGTATTASFVNLPGLGGFVQGGNSFGSQALIGTNDNQSLALETSGSIRMFVSSSGNIGIRNITPARPLTVQGADDTTLQIRMQGTAETTSYCEIGRESSSTGDFRINVCRTGTVINALRISDTTGAATFSSSVTTGGSVTIGTGGIYTSGSIYSDSNWGMIFRARQASPTNAEFRWANSADTELMRIAPSGNVGIGTTGPNVRTEIAGTEGIVALRVTTNNGGVSTSNYSEIQLADNGAIRSYWRNLRDGSGSTLFSYNDNLRFLSGATDRMIINSAGNVGIGTTSPQTSLHVTNSGGARLRIESGASTFSLIDFYNQSQPRWSIGIDNTQSYGKLENRVLGADAIRFYDSTNNLVLNPTAGNVGIRNTTPYSPLTITGASTSWGETVTYYPAPNGYTTLSFRLEGTDTTTGTWAIGKESSTGGNTSTQFLQVVKNGLTGSSLYRPDGVQAWDVNGNSLFGFRVGINSNNPAAPLSIGNIGAGTGTSNPTLIDLGSTFGTNVSGKNQKIKLWSNNVSDNFTYGMGISSALLEITAASDASIAFFRNGSTPTELGRFTNSGAFLTPLQPSFLAFSTSSGFSVTGGAWINISTFLTVESYDIGSNYSSGRFTAPVAGRYFFYAGGYSSISSNDERYAWSAVVNGGPQTFIGGGNYCLVDSPLAGYSVVYNLAAGDYVDLFVFSAVGGTWGPSTHRVFFGGYLM